VVERSVRDSCRFVLTPEGRDALHSSEVCSCPSLSIVGGLLSCLECGTVYGKLSMIGGGSPRQDFKAVGR
jgi:hypothetical protein